MFRVQFRAFRDVRDIRSLAQDRAGVCVNGSDLVVVSYIVSLDSRGYFVRRIRTRSRCIEA